MIGVGKSVSVAVLLGCVCAFCAASCSAGLIRFSASDACRGSRRVCCDQKRVCCQQARVLNPCNRFDLAAPLHCHCDCHCESADGGCQDQTPCCGEQTACCGESVSGVDGGACPCETAVTDSVGVPLSGAGAGGVSGLGGVAAGFLPIGLAAGLTGIGSADSSFGRPSLVGLGPSVGGPGIGGGGLAPSIPDPTSPLPPDQSGGSTGGSVTPPPDGPAGGVPEPPRHLPEPASIVVWMLLFVAVGIAMRMHPAKKLVDSR